MTTSDPTEQVRARYAAAARRAAGERSRQMPTGGCSDGLGAGCHSDGLGASCYPDAEVTEVPAGAVAASLGCGNPVAVAALRPGETVLDLGSGGGLDVLVSARRVGPTGHAIGLDMTEEMLDLARRHAREAGVGNVEFRRGRIEDLPLGDASVDVVISNCVIALSADKPRVFAEIARVLRPGGRVGISDVLAHDALTDAERAARTGHVECLAGALTATRYRGLLTAAGLTDVEVHCTHDVGDKLYAAIVRARRPGSPRPT